MAITKQSQFNRVLTVGSKIPIFTGKPSDSRPWLAAPKKKERFYQLTDTELINLTYDFTEGLVSEMIGEFLDDHSNCTSNDLLDQEAAQYSKFTNAANAARSLTKIKQDRGEVLVDFASRINRLAKLAYRDTEVREGPAVQRHLSKFFIDALRNPFIKEDVVRSNPATLLEALSAARQSEMLYERLRSSHIVNQATIHHSLLNYSVNENQGPRLAPTKFRLHKTEPDSSRNAVRHKFCEFASARLQRGHFSHNSLERACQWSPEEELNNFSSGKRKARLHSQETTHDRPTQGANTWICKSARKGVTVSMMNTRVHGCPIGDRIKPEQTHPKNKSGKKTRDNKETRKNKLSNQSSGMEFFVKIRGRSIEALIDPGLEVSLLKKSVFEELKTNKDKLRDYILTVTLANGQTVTLKSMMYLPIKMKKMKASSRLFITPDLDRGLILGADWLQRNRAQITFYPNQLTVRGVNIPLGDNTSSGVEVS